jgi:hypothetical protein
VTLDTGTRLGPYEILSAIGAVGVREVYRATDTALSRQVAIGVLPEECVPKLFISDEAGYLPLRPSV